MCPWGGKLASCSAHSRRPSAMWEKTCWVPREHSPAWGRDRLGRGYLPGLRANSHWCEHVCTEFQPLGHCSLLVPSAVVWLCQDSHSLGAGQDINLTEQWLDSHIFSAEHSINLIKQQITKPDESYDSGPNSVALSGSWKSFPLTFVMGERKHSRGGGCGDNLFLCIQGSGCLEWKDAVCTMAR